jgi:signal transduction histidine kinase
VVLPSGEVRHLEGRGQLDPADLSFMVGVVYDVTERELAAAREAELQLQALHASDVERDRIAADLHDGPLQALAAAWMRLGILASRLDRLEMHEEGEELSSLAREIAASLGRTNQELRDVLARLQSLPVDASLDTFVQHVADLGEELAERNGFVFEMRADAGGLETLPGPVLATMYRIVAEAVRNAAAHARPHRVVVDVRVTEERLVGTVTDDGEGFDTSAPGPAGHFGLAIMRQRATGLKGSTTVRSSPGSGTTVTVVLPLPAGALDPTAATGDDQTG